METLTEWYQETRFDDQWAKDVSDDLFTMSWEGYCWANNKHVTIWEKLLLPIDHPDHDTDNSNWHMT
jgi:hypothetical protein